MPEKILVRATNWVGDLVMATPALMSIKKNFPGSHISVLVKPPLGELLEGNPAVDEVILYDRKEKYKGPAGIARIARDLRKMKFDRAILLQNAFEAALVSFLAKIPVRMGYNTDGRGLLLTNGIKVSEATRAKHQVFYYLDLLKGLGMSPGSHTPRLYLGREDSHHATRVLHEYGISQGDLIVGINPGAQYGIAKKWFPERFGAVADRLMKEYGAKVIIFGGPGDVTTARTVEASMRSTAINMAGKTTIRGLMSLIKRCKIFITNDSGPMHISAALSVPTLAIFASTDPVATGPFGDGNVVMRSPVNCSPCLKRQCPQGHYRCMEQVTAEGVYAAAKKMIEGRIG